MTVTVRRIEPVSLAKVMGIVYALLMLVFGIPMGLFMMAVGGLAGSMDGGGLGAGFGLGMGLMMMIMYPIMGAVMGFIGGLLTGYIYNLVADRIGGVDMELDGIGDVDIL